ncbi:MAG: hypothetical protein AAGG02_03830 [Cyanobacteria bacterium P01_H01_bin.15]
MLNPAVAAMEVCVELAKGEDALTDSAQALLQELWQELGGLAPEVSIEQLLATTPDFSHAIAVLDYPCRVALTAVCSTFVQFLGLTNERSLLLSRLYSTVPAETTPAESLDQPGPPCNVSRYAVKHWILDYAIATSIVGFNPFPQLSWVTTIFAWGLMIKMIWDLRALRVRGPHQRTMGMSLTACLGCFSALTAAVIAWLLLTFVGFWIPFVGEFGAAGFFFILTFILGQTFARYYLSSRAASMPPLVNSLPLSQSSLERQLFVQQVETLKHQLTSAIASS